MHVLWENREVRKLLVVDSSERMSADEALAHAWIKDGIAVIAGVRAWSARRVHNIAATPPRNSYPVGGVRRWPVASTPLGSAVVMLASSCFVQRCMLQKYWVASTSSLFAVSRFELFLSLVCVAPVEGRL